MTKITAPWTLRQVHALNRFQANGMQHPFTCPNDHGEMTRDLVATKGGWICLSCDYVQDWAHAFMARDDL